MIKRLYLRGFRNYAEYECLVDTPCVVLTGANGAGKTNILEALSLLSPGQGLHRSAFSEMSKDGTPQGWAVSVTAADGSVIGTSWQPQTKRRIRINDGNADGADLLQHLRVLWLTPEHDRLFTDSPSVRRKFLDRLVFQVYPGHLNDLMNYEQAQRQRFILLREPRPDSRWLHALETRMAAAAPSITRHRRAVLEKIAGIGGPGIRPFTSVYHDDGTDTGDPAVWAAARDEDIRRRITTLGPHRHDWTVILNDKEREAAFCSTGEQKMLLFAVTFAFMKAYPFRQPTLLLLDDIVSHLDGRRRNEVLDTVRSFDNLQVWLTGTEAAAFAVLPSAATGFIVVG